MASSTHMVLGCHLATHFRAPAAAFRTPLTVIVDMRGTLLRTPVANLRAQSAVFLHVLAVASNRLGTEDADRETLAAAGRALVVALQPHHGL